MIVLISGGTGSLGRLLMREVVRAGHVVRIMTQRESLERLDRGVEWVRANLVSGAGLEAAVQGIDTVVHLASNFREPERVDVAGTRRLKYRALRVSHTSSLSPLLGSMTFRHVTIDVNVKQNLSLNHRGCRTRSNARHNFTLSSTRYCRKHHACRC
jgi:nucleoside-diphosphate-sugar epimerase